MPVSPEDDLGIPVLGRLAIKGDADARRALREHVAEGDGWAEAIEALSYDYEAGRPVPDWEDAVAGLDEVLVDRFGSDLDAALWDAGLVGDVWKIWAATNPWIADALADDPVIDDEWRPPLLRTSILASLPARGLLALEPPGDWRRVGMALGNHAEDVDLILAAAHDAGARDAARGDPRAGSARPPGAGPARDLADRDRAAASARRGDRRRAERAPVRDQPRAGARVARLTGPAPSRAPRASWPRTRAPPRSKRPARRWPRRPRSATST